MKINLHKPLFRVVVFLNSISVKVPKIKETDSRKCRCRTQQNAPAVSECPVHSDIDWCQRTGALREICYSLGLHKVGFFPEILFFYPSLIFTELLWCDFGSSAVQVSFEVGLPLAGCGVVPEVQLGAPVGQPFLLCCTSSTEEVVAISKFRTDVHSK